MMKKKSSNSRKFLLIIFSFLAASALLLAFRYYTLFFAPNTTDGESFVHIPRGTSLEGLIDSLENSYRIRSIPNFEKVAKKEGLSENIKPGRYLIKPDMNNRSLVRMIRFGWQEPLNLTISGNIRTPQKLSSLLSKKFEFDSVSFIAMLDQKEFLDSLGLKRETFISVFLPNTYQVYWTVTPRELILRMKKEFDKFWNSDRIEKARKIGLSAMEVITLASIVSQESNVASEQPVIAGVYLNRLRIGMPLQADPTVKFATGDDSLKRILNKHLETDSPYNTYLYKGLPPGPIVIPPLKTIDAVLNYQQHKYLYFCAKPTFDGTHNFAVTLSEHNRNAAAYQRSLKVYLKR